MSRIVAAPSPAFVMTGMVSIFGHSEVSCHPFYPGIALSRNTNMLVIIMDRCMNGFDGLQDALSGEGSRKKMLSVHGIHMLYQGNMIQWVML